VSLERAYRTVSYYQVHFSGLDAVTGLVCRVILFLAFAFVKYRYATRGKSQQHNHQSHRAGAAICASSLPRADPAVNFTVRSLE